MTNFIRKTFGGLKTSYLIRQYLFGLIFAILMLIMPITQFRFPDSVVVIIAVLIMWGLYPYSRFVYESVVDFIIGNNIIISNIGLYFIVKIMAMAICFVFSIFIAPLGLLYIYFHQSKLEKESKANVIED